MLIASGMNLGAQTRGQGGRPPVRKHTIIQSGELKVIPANQKLPIKNKSEIKKSKNEIKVKANGIPEHKVKLVGALIDWRKATDCESKYPNHLRYAQHPATDPGCF